MTYPNIRLQDQKKELDRGTWAGPSQVILDFETVGAGETTTGPLTFQGLVFDEPPLFTYGVELGPDQTLIDGQFPFVNCGVVEWVTKTGGKEDITYYTGANVWIKVMTLATYRLVFQLAFEGTTFKNTDLIK